MKSDLLDINHTIYKILPKLAWWNNLKDDPDIYIEIRKDNVVDAYYYGARIAEIKYNSKSNNIDKIEAKCHRKYVYGEDDHGKNTSGKNDDYVSCLHCLESKSKLSSLKKNALKYYVKRENEEIEDTSEKRIQGRLRVDNDHIYVDSEFEYSLESGTRNTIRFDLVSIIDNTIRIVELKRMGDSRLLTKDANKPGPEILSQMANYKEFIEINSLPLIEFYEKLTSIRKMLGLSVPSGYNQSQPLKINKKPLLLIKNLYQYGKMSSQRHDRISKIKSILIKNNIDFEILP